MIKYIYTKEFILKKKSNDFRLNIEYNNRLLPYHFYRTEVTDGHPDTLFHWHPELEINYVYEGTARYHIDYDFFNSTAGDIILIRPNGMHSIHPIPQKKHITDTFLFHLDMIGYSTVDQVSIKYLQPLQNSTFKFIHRIQPSMDGYAEIKAVLFQILKLSKNGGRHFEILLKANLNELMYLLYYHRYVVRKNTEDSYRKDEKIRDLIDYINNHYQDELTIPFLANRMGYSKTHFMSVFKKQTGSSCTEFIIQVRLRKACHALIDSHVPIIEIASLVGFKNLSNFNRQFKNYYQMTPSQYRKKHSQPKLSKTLINPQP